MRKIITPETVAIATGLLTIGTLFAISEGKNKDASTTAAAFFTNLCALVTSNAIATLVSTGATVTAATYTFVAKPLSWMHNKCCGDGEKKNENRYLLANSANLGPNEI